MRTLTTRCPISCTQQLDKLSQRERERERERESGEFYNISELQKYSELNESCSMVYSFVDAYEYIAHYSLIYKLGWWQVIHPNVNFTLILLSVLEIL